MGLAGKPRLAVACAVAIGAAVVPLSIESAPRATVGRVSLHLAGSESVKARIFRSDVRSCEERESAKEFEGVIQPGTTVVAASGCCLCVQQTYAPLINVGWSIGAIQCRYPGGKYSRKYCDESDLARPLEFTLTSRE